MKKHYVELWFIGYELTIENDMRVWRHVGTGIRVRDQGVLDQLEYELEIQEDERTDERC